MAVDDGHPARPELLQEGDHGRAQPPDHRVDRLLQAPGDVPGPHHEPGEGGQLGPVPHRVEPGVGVLSVVSHLSSAPIVVDGPTRVAPTRHRPAVARRIFIAQYRNNYVW